MKFKNPWIQYSSDLPRPVTLRRRRDGFPLYAGSLGFSEMFHDLGSGENQKKIMENTCQNIGKHGKQLNSKRTSESGLFVIVGGRKFQTDGVFSGAPCTHFFSGSQE